MTSALALPKIMSRLKRLCRWLSCGIRTANSFRRLVYSDSRGTGRLWHPGADLSMQNDSGHFLEWCGWLEYGERKEPPEEAADGDFSIGILSFSPERTVAGGAALTAPTRALRSRPDHPPNIVEISMPAATAAWRISTATCTGRGAARSCSIHVDSTVVPTHMNVLRDKTLTRLALRRNHTAAMGTSKIDINRHNAVLIHVCTHALPVADDACRLVPSCMLIC